MADDTEIVEPTPPKKRGRPSKLTPEIKAEIIKRLTLGETLTDICESSDAIPSRWNIIQECHRNEEFRDAYTRAREDQQHSFADAIMRKARDESRDYYVDSKGERRSDNTSVQRDRLIVDSMKFLMSKLAPKTYGDHMPVGLNLGNGNQVTVNIIVAAKTPGSNGSKDPKATIDTQALIDDSNAKNK